MARGDDIGADDIGGRSEETSAGDSRPHAGGLTNPGGGGQTSPGHGPEDVPPAKEGADFGGGTPEDLKPGGERAGIDEDAGAPGGQGLGDSAGA